VADGEDVAENSTQAQAGLNETEDPEPAKRELMQLEALPITSLSISSLLLDNSPRQSGENDDHVRVLAESHEQLPPIVVHGPSMRVIDGIHRVRAAIRRGEKKIRAKIYHGTDDEAFVLGVRMNIAHGLPLARADRTAAAVRIIGSHPQWSNRMIATAVGLSAMTVARVRRSTEQTVQSTTRVGKDGRVRPLNSAAGRLKAAELLAEKPTLPMRAIAKEAGVSSSTVHDVRHRLRSGQQPTLEHQRTQELPATPELPDVRLSREDPSAPGSPDGADVTTILADLKRDPSLQSSGPGQSLLRILDKYRVEMAGSNKMVEMVPDHCASSVAKLAREYARVWTKIAAQLEERRALPPRPSTST
jgi:ParB-like chromosome segregation protein Spo0J